MAVRKRGQKPSTQLRNDSPFRFERPVRGGHHRSGRNDLDVAVEQSRNVRAGHLLRRRRLSLSLLNCHRRVAFHHRINLLPPRHPLSLFPRFARNAKNCRLDTLVSVIAHHDDRLDAIRLEVLRKKRPRKSRMGRLRNVPPNSSAPLASMTIS
jgi:hypothetical protein